MRFHVAAASLALPIVLIACGGSSGAPPVPGSPPLQTLSVARAVPQPQMAEPAVTATQYLYIADGTTGTIDGYTLPMSSSSVVSKTIPIVEPAGYAISSMAVDGSGNVLYVSTENDFNYPPPDQLLYRCAPTCARIGKIPGGSGIAIANSKLYATAAVSAGNGYDTSEILTYAYSSSQRLGVPTVLYQDGGMDYTPLYSTIAVNSGYLAASGSDFPPLLVCTDLAKAPRCLLPSLSPNDELNAAVALNATHALFVGLKYYGPAGFGEICRPNSSGAYGKCSLIKIGNQGDEASTAAVDSSNNFYDIAGGTLYVFKNATTITLSYPIAGLYGPIAVGK
jgi:hypothetical protein